MGNSSSVHFNNKKKDILVLGEGRTQGLDDTTITAEAKYSVNFLRPLITEFYLLMLQKYNNLKQEFLK